MATNYDRKDLALVKKFFISYHNEFTKHIEREEKEIFPYVMEIEKAMETGFADNVLLARIKKYPIKKYAKEHENVDEKVNDLYNILIKYLPPLPNEEIVYSILYELFDLERDVKDHSLIEDKILIPKVSELESNLLNKKKKAI
jgi:regulator of cell morphogenesis and NO signaling